ncbi:MAG: hydroxymethylbilane synthase [Pseudomonadota bacterium]
MSLAEPRLYPFAAHVSQGQFAALIVVAVGALCLLLQPYAPWLVAFPAAWTVPATDIVGAGLEAVLNAIKPVMRFVSWLLSFPMAWANAILAGMPWPFVIGLVTAVGWHLGGVRMAALGFLGFGFVLMSGYWTESMNTLSLVAVSVPLAIAAGGLLGILANEYARLRAGLLAMLDAMQTIPTLLPDGLAITALLPREDVRDAFISPRHESIAALPEGAVVGTSSLRRRAQLLNRRPDLTIVEFRGNVQTRMRKLGEGVAEATFLACAGLNRLGMAGEMRGAIEPEEMLPAVAQGAIGIESREGDERILSLLEPLHHRETGLRLEAERAFLAGLDGSCRTPIGGLAMLEGDTLWLRGEIVRPDGSERLATERRGAASDAAAMGADAAEELRGRGGHGFFEA